MNIIETPVEKVNKGFYCTLKMFEECSIEGLSTEDNLYEMTYKKNIYLIQREGKCDYKACDNACCRFCHITTNTDGWSQYWNSFGKKTKYGVKFVEDCKNLNSKTKRCKLWGDKLPSPCEQFPHPNDMTYLEVFDKCSFKFKILYKLTKIKKEVL